jgi:hypothetical protein
VLVKRTMRILVVLAAVVGLAGAAPAEELTTPRVQVSSPWTKDDTVGDADRSAGDVRKIVVENGRQNVRLTFRMQANPIWDTAATSRATHMAFLIDWQGTTAAYNRRVTMSRSDNGWNAVVFNGTGGAECIGPLQALPNRRFRATIPVVCLGGAHVIRVAGKFNDDHADDAEDDIHVDRVPNSGGYGPFVRLPGSSRSGDAGAGGWVAV